MEDKDKKLLVFVVVILVIALVGCAFYIGKLSNTNKTSNTSSTTTSESTSESTSVETGTTLDVNGTIVKDLMENGAITVTNSPFLNHFGYFYKQKEVDLSNLPNTFKIMAATVVMDKDIDTSTEVSKETFKTYMVKVFGSNISYTDETIKSVCNIHTYDSQKGVYVSNNGGCGGVGYPVYSTKVIDAKQYSDRIEVTIKAVYVSYNLEASTETISKASDTSATIVKDIASTTSIDSYFDQGDTYLYTFKKDTDGHYYFYSIEMK
jgi:hypothetical protein